MRTFSYLALAFSVSQLAHAGAILQEDFESAAIGFYGTAGSVITGTAFSLVSGSIDINGAGPGNYGWLCVSTAVGQCVDTTGSTGSVPGRGVFQTTNALNLDPGVYTLSFSLVHWNDTQSGGGPQDASILVSLGWLYSELFTVDGTWVNQQVVRTITVGSSTSANLQFADQGGTAGYAGAIVDNVSLSSSADNVSSVPEPATYGLIGMGLMALGIVQRSRRANY